MKTYFTSIRNPKTNRLVDVYVKPNPKMIMPKMLAGIGAMLGGLAVGATIIFHAAFENGVKESNVAEYNALSELGLFKGIAEDGKEEITTS